MIPVSTPRAPKSTRFTSTATTEGSQLLQPETRKPSDDADAEIDDGNFRVVHSPKTEYVKTSLKGRPKNYASLYLFRSLRSVSSAVQNKLPASLVTRGASHSVRRSAARNWKRERNEKSHSQRRASEPELLSRGSLDR